MLGFPLTNKKVRQVIAESVIIKGSTTENEN